MPGRRPCFGLLALALGGSCSAPADHRTDAPAGGSPGGTPPSLTSPYTAPTVGDVPPHVVLVLGDDLGWTDLASSLPSDGNGSDYYQTPRLDELAEQSVSFTAAWAAPVCSPGRALVMTGHHAAHTGLYNNEGDDLGAAPRTLAPAPGVSELEPGTVTVARRLKDAGWRTGHFGKWHLGLDGRGNGPSDLGFDENHGGTDEAIVSGGSDYNFAWEDGRFDLPGLAANGVAYQFSTDRLVDEVIGFLSRDPATPAFAYLATFAVHNPIQSPEADLAAYDGVPPGDKHDHLDYGGMLHNLDQNVGRLVDFLATTPDPRVPGDMLLDHTILVFASDNGGEGSYAEAGVLLPDRDNTDNAPLSGGKGTLNEGGIRVPLIVRAPGAAPGQAVGEPVQLMDLAPTILDLAGLPPAEDLDGDSLVPLLEPSGALDREPLVLHFPSYLTAEGGTWRARPTTVARDDQYKLWYDWETRAWRLFDLVADPGEQVDLAAERPEVVASLGQRIVSWLDETDADRPFALATGLEEPPPALP